MSNVAILHETEIEIANGRRLAVTAILDDDGTARTVVAIESRTGRTVHYIEVPGAYALQPLEAEDTDDA